MKKIFAIIAVLVVALAFAACQKQEAPKPASAPVTAPTSTPTTTAPAAPAAPAAPTHK